MVIIIDKDLQKLKDLIDYLLTERLEKWWTVKMITAHIWGSGLRPTQEKVKSILDQMIDDYEDDPWFVYERDIYGRYRCQSHFLKQYNIVSKRPF